MDRTGLTFDDSSLHILRKLVSVLLPLDAWIAKRIKEGRYQPPNAADLPWRKPGSKLTTDQLGVVEFIVALIRESASDGPLLERWHAIQADPLKYCPLESKDEWRSARGLHGVPRFGIDATENMPIDDSGRQMARSQIYSDYLPLLVIAAEEAKPKTDDEWKAFALNLFNDTCTQWSQSPRSYRSSKFLLQLLRDTLYATLGMRNPVAEPWRSAVLTEIGEYRRPGNIFTRADIEMGLKEFQAELEARPVVRELYLSDSVRDHYLDYNKHRL